MTKYFFGETEFFIFPHCTVWKNEKFTLTQNFSRQINYLVILLVKPLLSRNFCQKRVRANVCNFHTVYYATLWKNDKFTLTEIFFRQINYLVILLVKPLLSRNFCQKRVRVNFRNFHTVHYIALLFSLLQIFRENILL